MGLIKLCTNISNDKNFYKGKSEGAMKNRLIVMLSKRLFVLAVIFNKLKGN